MERSCNNISGRAHAKLAAAVLIGLFLTLGCGKEQVAMPTSTPSPTSMASENPSTTARATPAPAPLATPTDSDLGMVYYVSYGWDVSGPPWSPVGGLGSRGWNDILNDNLWTGFVTNRPALGFYASADPKVIESHLRQMDAIGVDFLLISYLGWGDADLDGNLDEPVYINAPEHEVVQLVLETIDRMGLDLKFALMVEPFMEYFSGYVNPRLEPEEVTEQQFQVILDRAWADFYSPYSHLVYTIRGKPLIAAAARFSWRDYIDNENRFTQRNIVWHTDGRPYSDWVWKAVDRPPSDVFADGTVFVWPRLDELPVWLAHPPRMQQRPLETVQRMDPFLKEGAYDQGWKEIFGRREEVDRVVVWSWNSWFDKVYIEPDSNLGYASHGDLLTRKTAYYYRLFSSGLPFGPMK